MKACCLATDTCPQAAGNHLCKSFAQVVSSAQDSERFPFYTAHLPRGPGFPGLDQMPLSGHDMEAGFSSSRGSPGNRRVFPDTEWVGGGGCPLGE